MGFWKNFGKKKSETVRKAKSIDWRFRRLSFEGLEGRRLLSAEPFCGPVPAPIEYLCVTRSDFEPSSISCSNAIDLSSISIEPTAPTTLALYSYREYVEVLSRASFQDETEGAGAVCIVDRSEFEKLEPGFYHNGVPYYSHLSALSLGGSGVQTVVFSDGDEAASADGFDATTNGNGASQRDDSSSSGGEEPEEWNLSLLVDTSQTDSNLSSSSSPNALIEGKGATVGATNPLEGANCFTIIAPALHRDYYATIDFGGSATFGTDYVVYSSFSNVMTLLSGGSFTYSGGSTTLIIVPLNDALFESPESVTATLNPPQLMGSGGAPEPAVFTYGTTSVTATIIDDDQWKVEVVAAGSDDNILLEPCSGELSFGEKSKELIVRRVANEQGASYQSLSSDYALDDSYPLTVEVALGGLAGFNSDYELRLAETESAVGTSVTIPAGETEISLYVVLRADDVFENDETIVVSAGSAWTGTTNNGFSVGAEQVTLSTRQAPEFVPYSVQSTTTVDNDSFSQLDFTLSDVWPVVYVVNAVSRWNDLRYYIMGGNDNGWFSIDSLTGAISATAAYIAALESGSPLTSAVTTLTVAAKDETSDYGSSNFYDSATVKIGEFRYARVYDPDDPVNRATRDVLSDSTRVYEDNQRSDYDNDLLDSGKHGGIIWCGSNADMSNARITIEVGADVSARSRILWLAMTDNHCRVDNHALTDYFYSGNFSSGSEVTLEVSRTQNYTHTLSSAPDLIIEIGYDVDNDGFLSPYEVKRTFSNMLISKHEYDDRLDLLNDKYTSLTTNVVPIAKELLGLFLNKNISSHTYTSWNPETISYAPNDRELSLSNGRGVDSPQLDSGNINCYIWSANSLFAEKIYDSSIFTNAVAQKIFTVADLTEASNEFNQHPQLDTYTFPIFDVKVVVNFTNPWYGVSDLHYALGHCTAKLDEVWATVKKRTDGSFVLMGFSISGVCFDLYDFDTAWGSSEGGGLSNAGFIIQNCHKHGVRAEGEIFRVEVNLDQHFSNSQGLSWNSDANLSWHID